MTRVSGRPCSIGRCSTICSHVQNWVDGRPSRWSDSCTPPISVRWLGTSPGPIDDVVAFIRSTLADAGDDRLEARRRSEDQARKLLDDHAGSMSVEQARALLKYLNADMQKGKAANNRFSPAFVGQTANGLVADMENLNARTAGLWRGTMDEALAVAAELLSDRKALPSAGTSYPTMLLYLRDPDNYAMWLGAIDRGLQRLMSYEPTKNPASGRLDDYLHFCQRRRAADGRLRHPTGAP